MSLTRRDFMSLFGVALASVLLTRCQAIIPEALTARQRLRRLWFRFGELADRTTATGDVEDALGRQMIAEHRAALDELVAGGQLSASVADLVQEAYSAAVYHVWRSHAPMTCYEPMRVDYAPSGAAGLVNQSQILGELASRGTIDPATLAEAQAALEHDMAFYALSEQGTQALYDRVIQQSEAGTQPIPSFDGLQLELTPDARQAAQFILDLLAGK